MEMILWVILIALLVGLWFLGGLVVNVIRKAFGGIGKLIDWLFH